MRGLRLKAEIVMGGLLVGRDRAFRLSLILVLALLLMAGFAAAGTASSHTLLVAAGTLGAVAGARLLAPGPALESVRRAAAAWWMPPVGRLAGSALFLAPVVGAAVLALGLPAEHWVGTVRRGVLAWGYGMTWAACSLALAPILGASPAAALGVLAVWLGGMPPSAVHELLRGAAVLQGPVVLLWNVLPLGWRAHRALAGSGMDAAVLGTWVLLGIGIAAWAGGRPHRDSRGWVGAR